MGAPCSSTVPGVPFTVADVCPEQCDRRCLSGAATGGTENGPLPAHSAGRGQCHGTQHQAAPCEDLPPCNDQECVDCTFHEWDDWASCDCTGLQIRDRQVHHYGTPCGKECNGTLQDSKRCVPTCHHDNPVNCSFSDWSEWTECSPDAAQANRTRTIKTSASNGGQGCDGDMVDTKPCGTPEKSIDCKINEWAAWTDCSRSCDSGQKTRMRRVTQHAAFGGEPCKDVLIEIDVCNTQRCNNGSVCKFSGWSDWHGCAASTQMTRQRDIRDADHNCGLAESEAGLLMETMVCPPPPAEEPKDCVLSDWQAWLPCSLTCGGGQQYRMREIAKPPVFGGQCPIDMLRETRACGENSCSDASDKDCQFSEWADWSKCSNECGKGVTKRKREIDSEAKGDGKGCLGPMITAKACVDKLCEVVDCKWGEWSNYSSCTCSCGGGSMWRQREIVQATAHGGAFCPAKTKMETAQCNVEPCIPTETCRDGAWAEWREWSECSASCDQGFQKRRRSLDVTPNQCGKPAVGSSVEYQTCEGDPCGKNQDCEFGDWGNWSACSCPCYGIHSRSRAIKQFKSGSGKSCDGPLTVKEQCNPTVDTALMFWDTPPEGCDKLDPPQNCTMGDWEEWTNCSVPCGDGQTSRMRTIESPNMNGGAPCTSPNQSNIVTMETMKCNDRKCVSDCVDCILFDWSEWSVCTEAEQKSRHRQFNMSNYCGKPCSLESLKETVNCTLDRIIEYCAWTEWSADECSATCGAASKVATRKLDMTKDEKVKSSALFSNDDGRHRECIGEQKKRLDCPVVECPDNCEPIDCSFGEWSSWSEPSCDGLCVQTRVVQTINNHCGALCDGPLIRTKVCQNITCDDKLDCKWDDWGDWSNCASRLDHKERTRTVAQMAMHGGTACNGSSVDVAPCRSKPPPEPVDCFLSDWGQWGPCSRTCNGGYKKRTRYIQSPSHNGGIPCEDTLIEVIGCGRNVCETERKADCEMRDWGEWSGCEDGEDISQQRRTRTIRREAAGGGEGCQGAVEETQACPREVVDCEMNAWTDWDECDKTCEGGQTTRHRQVKTRPRWGGTSCEPKLVETVPCNEDPCVVGTDCVWGSWEQWKECPVTCGLGQQQRARSVTTEASDGGLGCAGEKAEVRPCGAGTSATPDIGPCGNPVDCVWGEWEWDEPCGRGRASGMASVGRHKRSRQIRTQPRDGGTLCAALSKREVVPCDLPITGGMTCVDGAWGPWQTWTQCTATCGGGLKNRQRMVATMANQCGRPVNGSMQEYAACNSQRCEVAPCEFADWREWTACTCSCNGIRERRRSIDTYADPGGDPCIGPNKEAEPCNQAQVTEGCSVGELNEDCVLGDWAPWQACSKTCGGGQKSRSRTVLTQNKGTGAGCTGSTSKMAPCGTENCPGVHPPVDCEWDEWDDWGACRSGVQDRSRPMKTKQENGGQLCEETTARHMRPCEMPGGGGHEPHWCTWAEWGDWHTDDCPVCGAGKQERTRRLEYHASMPDVDRLYEESRSENEVLRNTNVQAESSRVQELATSFVAGMACLMAFSFFAGRWSHPGHPAGRIVRSRDPAE